MTGTVAHSHGVTMPGATTTMLAAPAPANQPAPAGVNFVIGGGDGAVVNAAGGAGLVIGGGGGAGSTISSGGPVVIGGGSASPIAGGVTLNIQGEQGAGLSIAPGGASLGGGAVATGGQSWTINSTTGGGGGAMTGATAAAPNTVLAGAGPQAGDSVPTTRAVVNADGTISYVSGNTIVATGSSGSNRVRLASGEQGMVAPQPDGTYAVLNNIQAAGVPTADVKHVMAEGETLQAISQKYGVSMQQIMVANGVMNPAEYRAGMHVYVPMLANGSAPQAAAAPAPAAPAATQQQPTSGGGPSAATSAVGIVQKQHTMAEGETLASIARRYGSTIEMIKNASGFTNDSDYRPGMTLFVPSRN